MAIATMTPMHDSQVRTASGLDILAGVWLLVSVWVFATTGDLATSNIILGIVVAVLAAARMLGAYGDTWLGWLNVILGLWVIISPWVLEAEVEPATWSTMITGIAIVILAGWSALAASGRRDHDRETISEADRRGADMPMPGTVNAPGSPVEKSTESYP